MKTHEFANLIEKNSDKLLKLIDDVLELSDLESSEDMELESTNIHICCEQAHFQNPTLYIKGCQP